MYIQWVMADSTQFSMRMDPELLRKIDEEAEREYTTRTELIKQAIQHLLKEKDEQERLKRVATELWLKREISEVKLKKVLSESELKDLKFGKQWIDEMMHEINS